MGAEERTVGAEEGRRAQDTAKTTPKKLQKIVIKKKRRLRLFFLVSTHEWIDDACISAPLHSTVCDRVEQESSALLQRRMLAPLHWRTGKVKSKPATATIQH